jgi:pyrroline-5-carboxylate reductase
MATAAGGVPPTLARCLALETVRGAARLALAEPEQPLTAILDALATPGGITRQGLSILYHEQRLAARTKAPVGVYARLAAS